MKHWMVSAIAVGTIKNRMAALRWWATKVNKKNVIARSNDHYGDTATTICEQRQPRDDTRFRAA